MHSQLDDDDFKYITDFADAYNQKVQFIKINPDDFSDFPSEKRWPQSCLYILLAHKYLPANLHRILYLDIDVAVNGDLSEYYNLDFEDNYMIVSKPSYYADKEPDSEFERFDKIAEYKIEDAKKGAYFNSGVILFNLDMFRQNNIDKEFYKSIISGHDSIFFDQGILNMCFAQNVKLLTTCKYNYRLYFSSREFFNRQNLCTNLKPIANFYGVQPKIIHYCGRTMGIIKPWYLFFTGNEVIDSRSEFFDLTPQAPKYYATWWKYARLVPDFDNLKETALLNNAIYNLIKKLTFSHNLNFYNQLGLESLIVPDYRNTNSIIGNDDLNNFLKPQVYRCVGGAIKSTVKNLPAEFIQKCGFRLTVKNIAAKSPDGPAVLQILEPNSSDASVYRRHLGSHKSKWSPWYKTASTADLKVVRNELALELQKQYGVCEAELSNLHATLSAQILLLNQNQSAQNKQMAALSNRLDNLEKQLKKEQAINTALKNSKSFKIGRAITFIPRKLRDACKKKNK